MADTGVLNQVISSNNAIDYLVRSTSFAKSEALVPTMTSDTTPEGECFGYGTRTSAGYYNYLPFSGDESVGWIGNAANNYVGYKFPSSVRIGSYSMAYNHYSQNTATFPQADFTVQASSDGINYDIFDTYSSSSPDTSVIKRTHTSSFTNVADKRYFKIQLAQSAYGTESGNNFVRILSIQFYSEAGFCDNSVAMSYIGANNYASNTLLANQTWCSAIFNSTYFESVLNVKVPTMTSNTTPSGECFYSGTSISIGSGQTYYAFDGNNSSLVYLMQPINLDGNVNLGYKFANTVKIYGFYMYNGDNNSRPQNICLQASTDGSSYTSLTAVINTTSITTIKQLVTTNLNDYQYYRMRIWMYNAGEVYRAKVNTLQFYGRADV